MRQYIKHILDILHKIHLNMQQRNSLNTPLHIVGALDKDQASKIIEFLSTTKLIKKL